MVNSAVAKQGVTMPPTRMTAREIADDLTARIPAQYPPGTQLVYDQLADLYGVSHSTIQRAMALLQDRGLAVYHKGIGWFVAEDSA